MNWQKEQAFVVYLNPDDRGFAESVQDLTFFTEDAIQAFFELNHVTLRGIQTMSEFLDEWNDTDDENPRLIESLMTSMITVVYVKKN